MTISRITDISTRGIYADLLRKFRDEGHDLYVATPSERRYHENTCLIKSDNITILRIRTLNLQKTNSIEKGLSTLFIEYQFLKAIKKHFSGISFDLVYYSTPPITFTKVVSYIKSKDNALSYLLLKDIFPQNAVDLGMIKKGGLLHKYFRKREKDLYSFSDFIGCMSLANVDFIRKNNPEIDSKKIEVNPNSIEPVDLTLGQEDRQLIREMYKIPINATVFIYGGNLGKPQGIDFLIDTLDFLKDNPDIFFIIAGAGTEYLRIRAWFRKTQPKNCLLLTKLQKSEFDCLLQACDAGMIFLDKRFTIPNFPSRLLSYLEFKLPVIAATDKNTDLAKIIQENDFGLWSFAGDIDQINENIVKLSNDPDLRSKMGQKGYLYLLNNYTVSVSYLTIIKHVKKRESIQIIL